MILNEVTVDTINIKWSEKFVHDHLLKRLVKLTIIIFNLLCEVECEPWQCDNVPSRWAKSWFS